MKKLTPIIAVLLLVIGIDANTTAYASTNKAAKKEARALEKEAKASTRDVTLNSIKEYTKVAEQFMAANPLEKVHLHMDNTSYFMGDTLWFKAYAVNAAQLKPTEESEILHVELLNPEGVVVRTQKYRLTKGVCDGSIVLDKELLSGFFEVRAYTKAMLNFGDQNYFTRVFPIFEGTQQNPAILDRKRTVGYVSETLSKKELKAIYNIESGPYYDVKFYPEGGNMVVGLKSKVAFQVRDKEGELILAKCKIVDSKGNVISSRSTHRGMGVFEITPNNEGYYMLVEGEKNRYELPQPLAKGCVVDVESIDDNKVKISIASNLAETMGVAVMSQAEILFAEECKSGDSFTLDKQNLKEGVNQVVIYNDQGQELVSRLFFVKNGSQPRLAIEVSSNGEPKPYARQELSLNVTDNNGNGVATDFSLSIYDDAARGGTSQDNIYTSLLLSSEVRGYIPNANYYFEVDDAERSQNLDLVMMVHGWSRYKWDEISVETPTASVFPYEKGLSIYGRVFLHEWETISLEAFNRYAHKMEDGPLSYHHYSVPTDNILPYNDVVIIDHVAKTDNTIYKGFNIDIAKTTYKSDGKDNRYCINYLDFNKSLNVSLQLNTKKMDARAINFEETDESQEYSKIFITDSEYRPKERLYDFYETLLGSNVSTQVMLDFPAVKVRYYNRGNFSPFYGEFQSSIYESVVNTPYTSLDNYIEYYDTKYILKKIMSAQFNLTVSDIVDNPLTSTNEQLYYNKMPYGTVSYISTLRDMRSANSASQGYVTTPLECEFLTVTWSSFSTGMTFTSKKFNFVIDSTIIHTSQVERMEIFNEYKSHKNFNIFSIDSRREEPQLTSSRKCPKYIVEYVGRIVDSPVIPSKPYRRTSRRVIVLQGIEKNDREFYSPDYSTMTPPASGDHRRTLYWNPNVRSNSQGNATITFYNNSTGGSYTIDAQTITSDGQIGTIAK